MRFRSIILLTATICATTPVPILAQKTPDAATQVDKIIVTARLREEAARDVPFALTVLNADALAARRIDDTQSLFRWSRRAQFRSQR